MPRARSRSSRPILPGEEPRELGIRKGGEETYRRDAGGREPLLRPGTDPREQPHVEGGEERSLAPRADDGQPAGLAPVARHLGDDLARGHAQRAGEARGRPYGGLDGLGDRAGLHVVAGDAADVEVTLVEAGALHGGANLADRLPNGLGVRRVHAVSRPHEHGARAAAQRLGAAHGRADPVAAGNVVRGRDDAAAVGVTADDERLRAQLGPLELLDRREERVEVEVGDDHARAVRACRESVVALGDRLLRVRPEPELDVVPADVDVRVVVLPLGDFGHAVHEVDRRHEVLEPERALERAVDLVPALRRSCVHASKYAPGDPPVENRSGRVTRTTRSRQAERRSMRRPSRSTLALGTIAAALVTAASLQAAPAVKTLTASVGPDTGPSSPISLKKAGAKISSLPAGTYTVKVNDKTREHNFYLFGPGVTLRTGVEFKGTRSFTATFKKNKTYRFLCTVDPLTMKGSFKVT